VWRLSRLLDRRWDGTCRCRLGMSSGRSPAAPSRLSPGTSQSARCCPHRGDLSHTHTHTHTHIDSCYLRNLKTLRVCVINSGKQTHPGWTARPPSGRRIRSCPSPASSCCCRTPGTSRCAPSPASPSPPKACLREKHTLEVLRATGSNACAKVAAWRHRFNPLGPQAACEKRTSFWSLEFIVLAAAILDFCNQWKEVPIFESVKATCQSHTKPALKQTLLDGLIYEMNITLHGRGLETRDRKLMFTMFTDTEKK